MWIEAKIDDLRNKFRMSDLAQFSHDLFFNSKSYVKNFVIALLDDINDNYEVVNTLYFIR